MTTAITATAWLGEWVQGRHLEPSAVERLRTTFNDSAMHLLVVPDFLADAAAGRLADFLDGEANFSRQFAVTDAVAAGGGHDDAHEERLVPEAEWLAAPPARRFLRFSVGPGRPERMSPGWMRYFAFRAALHDARFAAYVQTITGLALGQVSSFSAHCMAVGDMLAPHNDTNKQRRMAFILYLSRTWHESFGGSLLVTGNDDKLTRIVPAFNTLVLFDVSAHRHHRVETVTEAAGAARRLSISGWFDHPPLAS